MPVRDTKKRRGHGWLAGRADIGWSNSLGWYEGFSLLTAVEPSGVITQVFVSGLPPPLSRAIGGDLLRYKGTAEPEAAKRAGPAACGVPYITEKGFEVAENHRRWLEHYGAQIIHPPKRNSKKPWSKRLRRWVAGIPQIVESVYDKLFNTFGLWRERDPTSSTVCAGSIGGESGLAQLLYLAQRATRSTPAGLRRLVGMVTSRFTPSV